MRNVQLALFSVLLGLLPVAKDWRTIQSKGFLVGYNRIVVAIIVSQALTGLVVALVMKYADTITKGFCTSIAVVLATLLSTVLWHSEVDKWFAIGSTMVVFWLSIFTCNICLTYQRLRLLIINFARSSGK
jgi:UDP-sugar transporter A1/2/3